MIKVLSRRTFLRGTGVALALPLLDAMTPSIFSVQPGPRLPRRRMVCLDHDLSFHPPYFFPEETGRDYKLPQSLKVREEFRNDFTVFSGLSHPGTENSGGHPAGTMFLSGAPGLGLPTFKNSISLDQLVAEKIGTQTRLPSLPLSSLSVSRSGVAVPPIGGRPSRLYAKLFLNGTPAEQELQMRRLHEGQSILDVVRGQAKHLERKVGHGDRQKLDEYFDSVRGMEQRLASDVDWAKKPKPKVDVPQPNDPAEEDYGGGLRLSFDLMHLAFQTDSTRLVTASFAFASGVPALPGITYDHHNLSHNGNDPEKLRQLAIVELDAMTALRDFLTKLKNTKEEGETLLDRTMVLVGSYMHSGNHQVNNLPILLAGGGFKHGQHLAFDKVNNTPLCNLYVMMLRQFGLEIDRFGTSSAPTIKGLETV